MSEVWERANEWETQWWGDCSNTADEEAKQIFYAEKMQIPRWVANTVGIVFDAQGKSILDIGGGPVSLLLKTVNRGRSVVVDPGSYPEWTMERYKAARIEYIRQKAEEIDLDFVFDEVWIYNCLQHVVSPEEVIQQAKRLGKTIRVFEWIDAETNIGHPHSLSQDFLEKQFQTKGYVITSPWGSATAEKAWVGISKEEYKMRFHLLGLAHTKTTKEFIMCAYTQKVYKLARMLTDLGHEVIHYGAEGSKVPCEHVNVINDAVWKEAYGDYDWGKEFFRHDPKDLAYTTFNENAIREILKRKQERDILLISFGNYQKPIADAVGINLTVEMGIGYTGVFSKFRIFESYAWMHYVYGLLNQGDGHFYDAVIPNYFDPKDFKFSKEKGDYFAYLGRLIARKGIQVASDTTKALGAKLLVAGQGNLKDLDLQDQAHITHLGSLNIEQRKDFLANAKALFVPTYYLEPFGGVAIEAMLSGTPVITSDWGAFSENVIHGFNGYRCRTLDDFIWAAKNVDKLDPTEIRKCAKKNFSMKRVAIMYEEYFNKLQDLYGKGWYELHPERQDLEWLKRY